MNNADFGMTLQSEICLKYNLTPCKHASEQFKSGYNPKYKENADLIISKVFKDLKVKPTKCTTYKKSDKKETYLPYNFILENGKTLSIRTSKTNKMVAPRVVGQAGYEVLNLFFEDVIGEQLYTQEQIRKAVYENVKDMLPVFVNYLLNSDYTVWVYPTKDNDFNYIIINNNTAVDIEYNSNNFSFTKPLEEWSESITLKYRGLSIAEIQTHKNRTFKFRFNFPNLIKLFVEEKNNNETIGISAEYAICKIFSLSYPDNFNTRISNKIVSEITPVIEEAFKHLPAAIKHTGSERGTREGQSKCSYDFELEGGKTLSLKTNIGKMVCPPEVGQPNNTTFNLYFKDVLNGSLVDEIIFKNLVLNNAQDMLPIYLEHLFDSDYLLWIYNENDVWKYKILEKDCANKIVWDKTNISFTKQSPEEWNESNTIKYKDKRIGEFQFHHHRNCYKFRFDFYNLSDLIEEVIELGTEQD